MKLDEIATKIAYINLKPDDAKQFIYNKPLESDFMGKDYILTCGSGYLKNYLQFLQKSLQEKIFLREDETFINKKEIVKLKIKKLYIPSELLRGIFPEESKKPVENYYKMKDVVKDYNYPGKFEVIPNFEIDEMIQTSEEDFFYFSLYTRYRSAYFIPNIITITNGNTGEIIYKESITLGQTTFSTKLFKGLSKLLIDGK